MNKPQWVKDFVCWLHGHRPIVGPYGNIWCSACGRSIGTYKTPADDMVE